MPRIKFEISEFMTYSAYSIIMFFLGFMANGDVAFMIIGIIVGLFFLWWKFENKQKSLVVKP